MSKDLQNPDIFGYTDPSLYLRDLWLLKKRTNQHLSIRGWAQKLGMKSHSQLHQMLYGTRAIPKKYIPKIVQNLSLNRKESDYFEMLLDIKSAKSNDEKVFYYEKIKSIKNHERLVFEEIDAIEMIRNPLNYFILEILGGRKNLSVSELKERLQFEYSNIEIKRSLETLLRLKLLIEAERGHYKKSKNNFYTKNDIPSEAIKEHHRSLADLAKRAIDQQGVDKREFSSTTMNIDVKRIAEIKTFLRAFREKFISEFATVNTKSVETYQFNMNLFAITKWE